MKNFMFSRLYFGGRAKRTKVILVNPSSSVSLSGYAHAPLGWSYIAAALLKNGHYVEIVDFGFGMDLKAFYDKFKEFKPDAVGITCMTPQMNIALKIARIVKQNSDCPLIFGGPHGTICLKVCLMKRTTS